MKHISLASFDHKKVIAKPLILTKTLIIVVYQMQVNFIKLFFNEIGNMVLLRFFFGLNNK